MEVSLLSSGITSTGLLIPSASLGHLNSATRLPVSPLPAHPHARPEFNSGYPSPSKLHLSTPFLSSGDNTWVRNLRLNVYEAPVTLGKAYTAPKACVGDGSACDYGPILNGTVLPGNFSTSAVESNFGSDSAESNGNTALLESYSTVALKGRQPQLDARDDGSESGMETNGSDEEGFPVPAHDETQRSKSRKKKGKGASTNGNGALASAVQDIEGGGRLSQSSEPIIAVMPPAGVQEALTEDLTGLDVETMVYSDAVYNKELSWLAFNWRVLYTALDPRTPLFERLRFVAITARNMDEFFSKRVGALKRQEAAGVENLISNRHRMQWTPHRQLRMVAKEVDQMVKTQLRALQQEILPALKEEGVHLLQWEELAEGQKEDLRKYFKTSLEPILTPLAVDPGHPFPFIGNMTVSIAVDLRDPVDDGHDFAIVNVPASCPRWRSLAFDEDDEHLTNSFISVEQIIRANLGALFGGMEIISANFFRVTRNADVARNEEEAEDLLEMINDEMRERKFAPFVRLEVDCDMSDDMIQKLTSELSLRLSDVYRVCGPLALAELDALPVKFGMATHLQYEPWVPLTHPRLQGADIFEVIRAGDLLVHHPYHSFGTSTQAFVEAAAVDPKARAIKATLYRTSADSPVISALAKAAEAGKQVAVLVELKARFDEARNVGFAQKLEDAGCNVAYGLVGLKTHCKCTMVVREEDDGFRTYVHIGTGNYNPRTASVYTDFGLFSCKPELGQDVADLFKYLTGYHRQMAYNKLLVAPGTMRREFVRLIDREIGHAKAGVPAGLVVKCNGLDDQVMVQKLYEASAAGVQVDLIIRGMCRVRPGVPGISDNIRVISVIGRFLEHHRIFRFANGGNSQYFIGSADWMTRNLMRRVEVVTPVEDENLKKELQDILDACLADRRTSWELRSDGRYQLLGARWKKDQSGRSEDNARGKAHSEVVGLHKACMDLVSHQAKKAKKVSFKKKDGSATRSRRMKETNSMDMTTV